MCITCWARTMFETLEHSIVSRVSTWSALSKQCNLDSWGLHNHASGGPGHFRVGTNPALSCAACVMAASHQHGDVTSVQRCHEHAELVKAHPGAMICMHPKLASTLKVWMTVAFAF